MPCECGCGGAVSLATKTNVGRGNIKGQPVRFISGHNTSRPKTRVCAKGHLRNGKCKQCLTDYARARRATPEGRTERVLENLKLRGGLSPEEIQRAKHLVLEWFCRPPELQTCPICDENCSGRKQMAADHSHATQRFRAMICQECNTTLGHSREREDLLGDGKLGRYLKQHQGALCAHAV